MRAYFSKGTDLSVVPPEKLYRVAEEVNDRPRKTLDWTRPVDLLAGQRTATA